MSHSGSRKATDQRRVLSRSERAEFALIKTAVRQTEEVSRFGREVLDEAGQEVGSEHLARRRLRREIETLALREASLKSLHETIAQTDRREESA